jgi:hypothetical protein
VGRGEATDKISIYIGNLILFLNLNYSIKAKIGTFLKRHAYLCLINRLVRVSVPLRRISGRVPSQKIVSFHLFPLDDTNSKIVMFSPFEEYAN